jgi:hypothetical protein
MYKNATKCNETIGKWCKNKHGASKIIDTFETYQLPPLKEISSPRFGEARKEEGFGIPRWLPPLKETFVGSLGLGFLVSTSGI